MYKMNSHRHYCAALQATVHRDTYWLDVGCGHTLLPQWMPDGERIQRELVGRCASVVGVDPVDTRTHVAGIPKVVAGGESLPFADHSFNLVTANMVVEHLASPELFLHEIFRVLRPGGLFLFHTPNTLYYQVALARVLPQTARQRLAGVLGSRSEEDIFPTFYHFNRISTIQRHAHAVGFCVDSIVPVETSPQLQRLGPVVTAVESVIIRMLSRPLFSNWRSNLIVKLRKQTGPTSS